MAHPGEFRFRSSNFVCLRQNGVNGDYAVLSDNVAQAFQPAGSGDFPVATSVRMEYGTGMSLKPADKNVCAT
jgi:hypothetical protein